MKIYQVEMFCSSNLITLRECINKFLKNINSTLVKAVVIRDDTHSWYGYVTYEKEDE